MNLIEPYSPGRGEQSARAASDPHAYCGTRGTFRTRSQRCARVLRHAENIPHAQQMIPCRRHRGKQNILCARSAHRDRLLFGSPFAVATRGGFSAGGEGGEGKRKDTNIPHAQPNICTRIAARGEHSACAANDPHAYCDTRRTFRTCGQ